MSSQYSVSDPHSNNSGPAGNGAGSTGSESETDVNDGAREDGEDGSVPAGVTWDEVARGRQQELYDMLSDRFWNSFKDEELEYLLRVVGHALLGPPDEEPSAINRLTGYKKEKLDEIAKICATIKVQDKHKDKTTETWVAVIFVMLKIEFKQKTYTTSEPVFRVPTETANGEEHVFIDRNNRVYCGWDNYLANNQLPECMYCYPVAGVYSGDPNYNVLVQFGTTPAGAVTRKVLSGADTVGTFVSVGTACVGLASLVAIPVAAPIALASVVGSGVVAAYSVGRGAATLIDRGKHGQSVGLGDSEARSSWLSIAGSTLGFAAAGATNTAASLARNGEILGTAGRFTVNAIQVSSLTVNGIGIFTGAINLHEKYKSDKLTPLDIFQFTSSVLFFTNSVVNVKTAGTIISENQTNVVENYRAQLRSNRHRKAFDKVARNTRHGNDRMVGNAKVIKGIRNINNPDDFFSGVARVQKHHKPNEAKMKFTDSNQVEINDKIKVEPTKFANVNKEQRREVLIASKKFQDGFLSSTNFDKIVDPIFKDNAANTTTIVTTQPVMPDVFNVVDATFPINDPDVKGPRYFFSNLTATDMQRIGLLLVDELGPKVLKVVVSLMANVGNVRLTEFVSYLEFSFEFVKEILADMEANYQRALELAKSFESSFCTENFDRAIGIFGDRIDHFLILIREMCMIGRKYQAFIEGYERYRQARSSTNTPNQGTAPSSQDDPSDIRGTVRNENSTPSNDDPIPTVDQHSDNSGNTSSQSASPLYSYPESNEYHRTEIINSSDQSSGLYSTEVHRSLVNTPETVGEEEGDSQRTTELYADCASSSRHYLYSSSQSEEDEDYNSSYSVSEEKIVCHHRDFSVHGPLTDEEHYLIAQEVSCLMVDASVVQLKRRGDKTFVMFLHCDIIVTISSDATKNRVIARVTS